MRRQSESHSLLNSRFKNEPKPYHTFQVIFPPIGYSGVDGRPTLCFSHADDLSNTHSAGSKRPLDHTDCLFAMTLLDRSRRSFLKTSVALAGATPLVAGLLHAQSNEASGPLIAYVGTFSSPLRDVLPTQVDLPPGNGRGIHLFQVNRATGAMMPAGIHEMEQALASWL